MNDINALFVEYFINDPLDGKWSTFLTVCKYSFFN